MIPSQFPSFLPSFFPFGSVISNRQAHAVVNILNLFISGFLEVSCKKCFFSLKIFVGLPPSLDYISIVIKSTLEDRFCRKYTKCQIFFYIRKSWFNLQDCQSSGADGWRWLTFQTPIPGKRIFLADICSPSHASPLTCSLCWQTHANPLMLLMMRTCLQTICILFLMHK